MTIDLDDALAHLASGAPHRGLAGLEDRVFSAIASPHVVSIGAGATLSAMGLALALGAMSNLAPVSEARASPLAPLGAPSALAPSTLLGGGQ